MDGTMVLVVTWVVAGLIVVLYLWFVIRRFRKEHAAKEAAAPKQAHDASDEARLQATLQRAAQIAPEVTPAPVEYASRAESAPEPEPLPATPEALPPPQVGATVAGLLTGIELPGDLTPLSTLADRPSVGDRVAFWTNRQPAEVIGPAFKDELERLGFTMVPIDPQTHSAQRDNDRLVVMLHPDGQKALIADRPAFTSMPENSVVIEVWVPIGF